jgi:lipopolysaccharide export system protein LptA
MFHPALPPNLPPVYEHIQPQSNYYSAENKTGNTIQFYSRPVNKAIATPKLEFTTSVQPSATGSQAQPRIVEVLSDKQEYDTNRRVVTALGKVTVKFDGAIVNADRLQVNLDNLIAVGEGNVVITRGSQILRGERFTYNFPQDTGNLESASGEIYLPSVGSDLDFSPGRERNPSVMSNLPSERILANQPISQVTSPGGVNINLGGEVDASNVPVTRSGGAVNRARFEAQRVDFYPRGWEAEDVRITNDPFSPPELELRASKVQLRQESPLVDRVTTQRQRLVFDQNFVLPIPIGRRKIDRRRRDIYPFIVAPGFDNGQRGGFYVERSFTLLDTETTRWSVTPQFFVQKSIENSSNVPDLFGVRTKINSTLGPRTSIEGAGELTTLNLDKLEDNSRGSIRLKQVIGRKNPYTLNLEYSHRDRLYNGTLGFQTVQSSVGGLISSPLIPLGKSGINLNFQGGGQYINSNTDRPSLLSPQRQNDRVSLGRLQASASLGSGLLLWEGKPLPATPKQGLKYTSNPIVPYLRAIASVTGTTSYYTSGDEQSNLIGTVGLVGQVGHFSRSFFDYTGFNISYSQGFNTGTSPFLFDRFVDNKVISAGISQQIYGPFRFGFQTAINVDTGKASNTDYIIEYNRRTYGVSLRYNPTLQIGSFMIRISDFNWVGGADPFSLEEVKPVVGGVRQD